MITCARAGPAPRNLLAIAFWDATIPAGGSASLTLHGHLNADSALQLIANTATFSYDLHDGGANTQGGLTNTVSFLVGSDPTGFYTVTPCRIVDTRNTAGRWAALP